MIRVYLVAYIVMVIGLWFFCSAVPDGLLGTCYGYARTALHIIGPVWIVRRAVAHTAQSILDDAEQAETYVTSVAAQPR